MATPYSNPALEAELAWRREQLAAAARRPPRTRRWFPRRRRPL
jgi:hypothetical protein